MLLGYFPKSFQHHESIDYCRARDSHEFAIRASSETSASAIKMPIIQSIAPIGEGQWK